MRVRNSEERMWTELGRLADLVSQVTIFGLKELENVNWQEIDRHQMARMEVKKHTPAGKSK